MKKQSNTILSRLNENELKNLTTIVSEKLGQQVEQARKRIFSAAELWNIQRQAKMRVQRRYSL